MMDPWCVERRGQQIKNTSDKEENGLPLKFEDNFIPSARDTLPDSEQYLALLEKKLHEIKNNPSVLKQLAEKREACLQSLLRGETRIETDDELDCPVENSQILRTIVPQKQALNKGEVVELIHYDQLEEADSQ